MDALLRRPIATPYGCLSAGDRVEVLGSDHRPRTAGTVTWVQDNDPFEPTGVKVHVLWDNGSTLAMRPSLGDRLRKL